MVRLRRLLAQAEMHHRAIGHYATILTSSSRRLWLKEKHTGNFRITS